METFKYVVIGGGLAGGRAADGIRALDPDGSLIMIAEEKFLPYQRPPLSKGYLTGEEGLDHVFLRSEDHYTQKKITCLTGSKATEIDPSGRVVKLSSGREITFEKLLLATGGHAWRLPIAGNDLEGVFTLRTLADCDTLRGAAASGMSALVIGGSFIGSEVAASLTTMGLSVTMVFLENHLMERFLPQEVSTYVEDIYLSRGVRLLPATKPLQLEGARKVRRAVLGNGEKLDTQLVIMGVGIRLNVDLAETAGLEMTERGAVAVDADLETSVPGIYAAGDIAAWPDPTFGKRLRVEHWDVARRQGTQAGRNMAGEDKPYTALPYFYSDLFDLSFEAWGDLSAWDQTLIRGNLEKGSFAVYYFHEGTMVGVLAAGRPEEERKPMQGLVKARTPHSHVAHILTDEQADLATLLT